MLVLAALFTTDSQLVAEMPVQGSLGKGPLDYAASFKKIFVVFVVL